MDNAPFGFPSINLLGFTFTTHYMFSEQRIKYLQKATENWNINEIYWYAFRFQLCQKSKNEPVFKNVIS